MAAARFWRAVGFDTRGAGDLELSALTLFDGSGRIDNLAALTAAHAPSVGTLDALGDSLAGTSCIFSAAVARSPGFSIVWDFGVGVTKDVVKIGVGSGQTPGASAERLQLHSSDDGQSWSAEYSITGIPEDGAAEINLVDYNTRILASNPVAFWPLDETSGTTAAELVAGRNGVRTNGALVSPGLVPLSPAAFDPATTGLISIPSSAAFDLSVFSFEFWVQTTSQENLVIVERNGNTGMSIQATGLLTGANVTSKALMVVAGDAAGSNIAGSSASIVTGLPVYCVVVATPAGALTYINGDNATKGSSPMVPNWGGAPLFIGSRAGAYGLPAGSRIGKVALYGRALTSAEVRAHYDGRGDIALGAPWARTPQTSVIRLAGTSVLTADVTLQSHDGLIRDMEYSGRGCIASTVKRKNTPTDTPLRRRVRLIHERSGLPIRETWSDPVTGNYRFEYIDEKETYTVVSYDNLHDYRAVVADNLTLANGGVELMS